MLWGGDQEGGAPYVFPKEDDPTQVTGFEVDLASRIAEYLRVRAQFTQGQWDKMPDMLRTGKIHAILSGYEFTSWAGLSKGAGPARLRIGVLGGSAAEAYTR